QSPLDRFGRLDVPLNADVGKRLAEVDVGNLARLSRSLAIPVECVAIVALLELPIAILHKLPRLGARRWVAQPRGFALRSGQRAAAAISRPIAASSVVAPHAQEPLCRARAEPRPAVGHNRWQINRP